MDKAAKTVEPGSGAPRRKRRAAAPAKADDGKPPEPTHSHQLPDSLKDVMQRDVSEAPCEHEGEAVWLDDAAKWAVIGVFLLLAVFALHWGRYFFIPATLAIAIGLTMGPFVDRLERMGVPPYLASGLIVLLLAGALYGLFLAFAIPLEEWSARVPEILDRARALLFSLRGTLEQLEELSKGVQEAASPAKDAPLEVTVRNTGLVTSYLATAPAVLAQMLILLGAFFFFLANRSRLRTWLLLLPVSQGVRYRIARIFRDTEYYLSRYVATITVVNIGLGIATGAAMWVVGMPSPALWGLLAAVLNFIPYLGPGLMTIIIGGVALVTFDQPTAILVPPLTFVGLNVIEGQFVTPTVLGHRLTLNPFVVFMVLVFWVWLWGPVGAFLAVPLLIFGTVTLAHAQADGNGVAEATFGKPGVRAEQLRRERDA